MLRHACITLPLLLAACGKPVDAVQQTAAMATQAAEVQPAEQPTSQAEAPEPVPEPVTVAVAEDTPEPAPPVAAPSSALAGPADFTTLIGDVLAASDPRFAPVPQALATRGGMYGRKEAVDALAKMAEAAKADGVKLTVVSAFRSFRDQKRIWEDKWDGRTLVEGGKLPQTVPDPEQRALKILEFSSMPATSRHHWGTDFDLNSLNNSYFASGEGKKVYDWLKAHGADYGFCQPYSPKPATRATGYEEERWHWSYLPIAKPYLAQYPASVGYDHIAGFKGSDAARGIDVIANYVAGINPDCR
jgi:LAS superfamily LD-carboxypeptidase LdcB